MSRFSLGLEGQEQDLELEHDSRDIEYESVADSHLSPAASRAFNNAIDDSESLSRMNDVLENSDLEDIPESSRAVIQTSMESIRARLLGGTQQRGVAVEGFNNRRQLNVAIEENKGIIASVWDAIINFFKGIYNFIAGFFGKSSKNNSNLSSSVYTLKQVASAKVEEPKKIAKKVETAKTERELNALEIFCQQQLQDINKQGSKLDSLNLEPIHVVKDDEVIKGDSKDEKIENTSKIDLLEIELKSYENSFENSHWFVILETSNFNKFLTDQTKSEELIKIDLDKEINSASRAITRLSILFDKSLKNIFTLLESLDKQLGEQTKDDSDLGDKLRSLDEITITRNSSYDIKRDIREEIRYLAENKLYFQFGEKLTDDRKHLFQIIERKNTKSLVTTNFSDLETAISDIQKLNKILSNVNPLIEKVQSSIEKLKVEDFTDKDGNKNSYLTDRILKSYKEKFTGLTIYFNSTVREMVKIISEGNDLLKAYSRIIAQVAKQKNKTAKAAFSSVEDFISEKRKELADLS